MKLSKKVGLSNRAHYDLELKHRQKAIEKRADKNAVSRKLDSLKSIGTPKEKLRYLEGTIENIEYNRRLHQTKEVYHQMAYDLQKKHNKMLSINGKKELFRRASEQCNFKERE
ncbi:MAG: hypothetical protein K6G28_05660 [Acholeplasmatales bacterium]|nr:hypothetical protein [Acholeplasmatales bacterium]